MERDRLLRLEEQASREWHSRRYELQKVETLGKQEELADAHQAVNKARELVASIIVEILDHDRIHGCNGERRLPLQQNTQDKLGMPGKLVREDYARWQAS
jgi:hypothetical protein